MPFIKPKKKNPFEASMPIDNPDVKVVTASFDEKPFFIGIGTSKQREVKGSGQVDLVEGVKGEYQSQKYLEWQLLYNPKVLPDFMPMDRLKNWMAGTVAVTSGSIDVFTPQTKFVVTDQVEWKKIVEAKDEKTIHELGGGLFASVYEVKKAGQKTIHKVLKRKKENERGEARRKGRKDSGTSKPVL
jgi:hypothetical protein